MKNSKETKFSEDDASFFSKEFVNLGELDVEIEKMENSIPDKRTSSYEIWKTKINFLMDTYNKMAQFKSFKKYE